MSTTHAPALSEDEAGLDTLLEFLKRARGFDFSGYKRTTLARRVAKRMDSVGSATFEEYLDHLEVEPAEYNELFNTILINVTGFFRDTEAWDYLAREVVPPLLERLGPDEPVRVWSAGVASGEEAYSVAMLLCEAMGEEAFKARVKIYATDVDEAALAEARAATFSEKQVAGVSPGLLESSFDRSERGYTFRPDLRRSVIFGRNDLIQDAPISRIDLLLCRNTLMYFNAEAQARILNRFHFALRDTGVLFLGKAEMLISHAALFRPVDLKCRVFEKVPRETLRDRLLSFTHGDSAEAASDGELMRATAFDSVPLAQVVIDSGGTLALANLAAREMLGIAPADLGRPVQDLTLSYRPVELRSLIEQSYADRRPVTAEGAVLTTNEGERRVTDVRVVPLTQGDDLLGASVTYLDVTADKKLHEHLTRAQNELETAYEELQSTVEELETTNEELQSTNEELETMNEELQSTNEELETMNAELQSTNEELETTNGELRIRSSERDEVNALLETILTSLGVAVVVVDADQNVQIWNSYSQEMWGLRAEEAEGRHLLTLDIGLPVEQLRAPLRLVLAGSEPRAKITLESVDRRGRTIQVEVTMLPLRKASEELIGVMLLIERLSE